MAKLHPLCNRSRDPGSGLLLFILLLALLFLWRERSITSNLLLREKDFSTGGGDAITSEMSMSISSLTNTSTRTSTSTASFAPQMSYHQVNIPNLPPLLFTTSSPIRDTIIPTSPDSDNTNSSVPRPKVYWTIFGGRHPSLKVQLKYMMEALTAPQTGGAGPVVDAVHIWDFTCRQGGQNENRNYLFKEIVLESPSISIVSILGDEEHKQPNISALDYNNFPPLSSPCDWGIYYKFYAATLQPTDVLLKIDDDVVFVDTSSHSQRLQGFVTAIRALPQVFLWSANVVNNGKSALVQSTLQSMASHHATTAEEETIGNGMGKLFCDSARGMMIHREFVQHAHTFFQPPAQVNNSFLFPVSDRLSINFIGFLGSNVARAVEFLEETDGRDDEHAVTFHAAKVHQAILVIFSPLVVAHASFGPQGIHDMVIPVYHWTNGDLLKHSEPWPLTTSEIQKEFQKHNITGR